MQFKWKKNTVYIVISALLIVVVSTLILLSIGNRSSGKDEVVEDMPIENIAIHMDMGGDIIQINEDGNYTSPGTDVSYGICSQLYSRLEDEYSFDSMSGIVNHLCRTYNMVDVSNENIQSTDKLYKVVCRTQQDSMDAREFIYGTDNSGYIVKYTERITSEDMSSPAYSKVLNNITNITGYNISSFNKDINDIILAGKGTVHRKSINTLNGDEISVYVENSGERKWEVSIAIRSGAIDTGNTADVTE